MKNGWLRVVLLLVSPPSWGYYTRSMRCVNGRRKVGHARPVSKRNLGAPPRKAHRETNDVKTSTPVRHLGAAGTDGIMQGPQAVTERPSEVVNHIKVELELFGQSQR